MPRPLLGLESTRSERLVSPEDRLALSKKAAFVGC
jgi:hypothetical protein